LGGNILAGIFWREHFCGNIFAGIFLQEYFGEKNFGWSNLAGELFESIE
jgi:hypothetical protein